MTDLSTLNWLAIIVAAISSIIVGGVWYGPLFGKIWMEENGFAADDVADAKGPIIKTIIANGIVALTMAYLMPVMGLSGWYQGAYLGATLALFIQGAGSYQNYAFERKSNRLFFIHLGNSVLGMGVMGAILGSM